MMAYFDGKMAAKKDLVGQLGALRGAFLRQGAGNVAQNLELRLASRQVGDYTTG